ncbi:hypothetical protein [Nitrosopumilus sp.]|uniref:hypothetical protein n=1 Tax=Nitrosopumilus sp. TaxID=2024843 RepID=UPI00247CF13E|nr:hypothetical protein [Nitrosopumilus sp.]MCV0431372.1 hypothetical protein [Nitrosopumilus sp.]
MWKGYTDSIYTYVEKTVPQYHQSITNLFQEYIETCKNIACSSIDIQKGFASKIGNNARLSEATIKIVNDIERELKSSIDVQNKIAIASINATKETLSTINANSNEFASLNRHIVEVLPSMIPKRT